MRVAIFGGKTLLDVVFLNSLSIKYPDLHLECYGDSGEISYGAKRIKVQDISILDLSNFDILINLSKNYAFILPLVKAYNALAEKKVKYFNCQEGDIAIANYSHFLSDLILLPEFGVEPICKLLALLHAVEFLNIFMGLPIVELGKEAMNKFHKEIKDSNLRIVQRGENNDEALAFNVNFSCFVADDFEGFKDSSQELVAKKQIQMFVAANMPILLNQARIPVNKGAFAILNFNLKKGIIEEILIKRLETAGFLYVQHGFSTIFVENDSQIYFTKLKKINNSYSIVLLFDSLQRQIINIIDLLEVYFLKK